MSELSRCARKRGILSLPRRRGWDGGTRTHNIRVKVWCVTVTLRPTVWRRDWDYSQSLFIMGWVKGLEPSTPGTTIRCSNQLSYTHHICCIHAHTDLLRDFWYARRDSNPRPTA